MAYQFTGSELAALQNAYNNAVAGGSWATVYATISASISTNGQPEAEVDQAVLSWVNGAQQVNAGVGDFSYFIRQYSTAQYVLRFGEASQTSLQVVSDAVARDLASKFYPFLSSLQRFWVAVFGAVAACCGAEPFRLRSTASRRGLIV